MIVKDDPEMPNIPVVDADNGGVTSNPNGSDVNAGGDFLLFNKKQLDGLTNEPLSTFSVSYHRNLVDEEGEMVNESAQSKKF